MTSSQAHALDPILQLVPKAATIGAASLDAESVLFHGINKSGSLAMAEVLRQAYAHERRQDDFMCRYMGMPSGRDEALGRFAARLGQSQILIDHDLVGVWASYPKARYVTMLRDPVKRLVSCYFWLRRFHPETVRGRDLMHWAQESGKAYTMCFQFACNAGPGGRVKNETKKLPSVEIAALGRAWFDEHVSAFGVAEYFEESVLWLGSHLGLPGVPAWKADLRNTERPKWEQLDSDITGRLQELLKHDIEFYESLCARFLSETRALRESQGLQQYRDACAKARWDQEHYGSDSSIQVREASANEIAPSRAEALHQRIADNLRMRGFTKAADIDTSGLKLVTHGLPAWWKDGRNALYVSAEHPPEKLPAITYPRTQEPPTETLLVLRCRNVPSVKVWGNAGTVYIAGNVVLPHSAVVCGDASLVFIGPRTRATAAISIDARNGGTVIIEGDCLMGSNCRLMSDDMHAILDASSGRRINVYGGTIVLGEHVWLGLEVIIQGGSEIERDCVVRARSIVSGRMPAGSLVEGAPARVAREGVTWDPRDLPM